MSQARRCCGIMKTPGKRPLSRPQHRGEGSRRAEQYANARSSRREHCRVTSGARAEDGPVLRIGLPPDISRAHCADSAWLCPS
jgi:hypothetical protein